MIDFALQHQSSWWIKEASQLLESFDQVKTEGELPETLQGCQEVCQSMVHHYVQAARHPIKDRASLPNMNVRADAESMLMRSTFLVRGKSQQLSDDEHVTFAEQPVSMISHMQPQQQNEDSSYEAVPRTILDTSKDHLSRSHVSSRDASSTLPSSTSTSTRVVQ